MSIGMTRILIAENLTGNGSNEYNRTTESRRLGLIFALGISQLLTSVLGVFCHSQRRVS